VVVLPLVPITTAYSKWQIGSMIGCELGDICTKPGKADPPCPLIIVALLIALPAATDKLF
jgi:hypothetical protein